jgi:(E)-4-hydroxy-3-methylbut-2-enyl-diphosphate synthase
MLTCHTSDTEACVQQTLELAKVGCQLVRLTTPTIKDAENLQHIVAKLRAQNCDIPLVADIHFTPNAAYEAAKWVEKIRINPGNFADGKRPDMQDCSDDEYQAALDKIEQKFAPLLDICKKLNRAIRIGSNHGSLSDRIMARYGDTPMGMVESALEYARIARKYDFHNIVFSMKASSPKVTIEAYRLLAIRLEEEGSDWNYPFHLGVTEAGLGTDGRIKSAIGIGTLLGDGLGDTLRVSLSEDSVYEIPVCRDLLDSVSEVFPDRSSDPVKSIEPSWDPYSFSRRASSETNLTGSNISCGALQPIRVFASSEQIKQVDTVLLSQKKALFEAEYPSKQIIEVSPFGELPSNIPADALVTITDGSQTPVVSAFRWLCSKMKSEGFVNPILLKDTFTPQSASKQPLLKSSAILGSLLCDGIGDAVLVRRFPDATSSILTAWNILQAAGARSFKTEYISCPSCGRTLFNIQKVIAEISKRTSHLNSVKIGIMGCIVNGPGEMADADFGYVGGAPGKITLYVGKQPVKKNIPTEEAVDTLIELIKEHGRWVDP